MRGYMDSAMAPAEGKGAADIEPTPFDLDVGRPSEAGRLNAAR